MTQYWYHVIPRWQEGVLDMWAVYAEGLENARRLFEQKSDAVEWAKEASRNDRNNPGVVVHGRDGWITSVDVNPNYDHTHSSGHPPSPKWGKIVDHSGGDVW